MTSRRSLIATIVLLTALAGCSGSNIRNADEIPPNVLPGSTPTRWHIDPNCAGRPVTTREDLAAECPNPTAHDFISIALSGGGTKAAIFSAETMFYLQALGLLPRTSVVSSVSGGSFAAAVYAISCDPADAVCLDDRPHALRRPVWEHDAVLTNMGQGYGKVVREQLARLLVPALGAEVTANRFADIIDSDYLGGGPGDGGRFLFRDVNPRRPHLFLNATITTENRGGLESVSNGLGCTPLVSRGHLRRRTPDEFFHFAFTDYYFGLLRSRVDNYPLAAGVAASAAFPALIANATLDDHCADAANNKILLMDGGANDNQALVEIYMVLAELVYGQHRSDLWNQPGKLEKLDPAGDHAWIFVVNSSVTEATGPSASGGGAQPRGDIGFFLSLVGRVLDATDVYSAEGYNLRKQLYLAERDRLRNLKGFAPVLPVEISLTELDQYRLGGTEAALRTKAGIQGTSADTDIGEARAQERSTRQGIAYDRIVDDRAVRKQLGLSDWHPQCYFNMRAKLDASLVSLADDDQQCLREAARWGTALRAQEICDASHSDHPIKVPDGMSCEGGRVHLKDPAVLGTAGALRGVCKPGVTLAGQWTPASGVKREDWQSLDCRHLD